MPKNYTEHFNNFNSLIGIATSNDRVLMQMINIHNQTEQRIRRNRIDELNHYIIRCSSNCLWIFDLENPDISNTQRQCPLCKENEMTNAQVDDFLIVNLSIRMNAKQTLQFISTYIKEHYGKDLKEYNCKSTNHLTQPITYHFIHLLTHSIFLFLNDLEFMPNLAPLNCNYFQKQIENDCALLSQRLFNVDQCYIWIYKLINHMINKNFAVETYLNSPEKVIQLEKLIEDKLILPHIDSVLSEIRVYKLVYADFIYENKKNEIFANSIDELILDDEQYPLIEFFNVTNIDSIDIIDDFYTRLQLLPDYEKIYPLTTFILKRIFRL